MPPNAWTAAGLVHLEAHLQLASPRQERLVLGYSVAHPNTTAKPSSLSLAHSRGRQSPRRNGLKASQMAWLVPLEARLLQISPKRRLVLGYLVALLSSPLLRQLLAHWSAKLAATARPSPLRLAPSPDHQSATWQR